MRIYTNLMEAHKEIERDLVEMGTEVHPETYQDQQVGDKEDFITKELQGYSYQITSQLNMVEDFVQLGGNEDYLIEEFLNRIDPIYLNPGDSYKMRKEIWDQFLHYGKFSYTYNERIRTQIDSIMYQLKKNPNTRQAVMTIYDQHQDLANMGGKARIPCSMHYQFLIREQSGKKKLDCIYVMRSCDFYTHFIYDVALTMRLQAFIANAVGIEPGRFIHFIGSLHAYRKDYEKKGVF